MHPGGASRIPGPVPPTSPLAAAPGPRPSLAAPGEVVDKPFFVVDLAGPGQFRKLERLLRAKGYGSARIEKIFGGNFLRVAGEVWGE
jgi:microsomal dipeptidase-like Zn-dependent dipeptidase